MEGEDEECSLSENSRGTKRLNTTMLFSSSKTSPCRVFSEDERLLDDVQGLPLPKTFRVKRIIPRSFKFFTLPEREPLSGKSSSEPGCSSGIKAVDGEYKKRDSNKTRLGGEGISTSSIEMYEKELANSQITKTTSQKGEQVEGGVDQIPEISNTNNGNGLSCRTISHNKTTTPHTSRLYNKKKKEFNLEEDISIIRGVVEENFELLGGHETFRRIFASNTILLGHTCASVRDRFRKHIAPNIQEQLLTGKIYYSLSEEVLDLYQQYFYNHSQFDKSTRSAKVLPQTLDKHIIHAVIQDRPGNRLATVYWTMLLKDLQVEDKTHVLLAQQPQHIIRRIKDFILPRMGELEDFVSAEDLKKLKRILVDRIYDEEGDYMEIFKDYERDENGNFNDEKQVELRKRRLSNSSDSDSSVKILGEYPSHNSELLMIAAPSVISSSSSNTTTNPKKKKIILKIENCCDTNLKIDVATEMDDRKFHNVGIMVQPDTKNAYSETLRLVDKDYDTNDFDSSQEDGVDDPYVSSCIEVLQKIIGDLESDTGQRANLAKNIISQLLLHDAMFQLARDRLYRH